MLNRKIIQFNIKGNFLGSNSSAMLCKAKHFLIIFCEIIFWFTIIIMSIYTAGVTQSGTTNYKHFWFIVIGIHLIPWIPFSFYFYKCAGKRKWFLLSILLILLLPLVEMTLRVWFHICPFHKLMESI